MADDLRARIRAFLEAEAAWWYDVHLHAKNPTWGTEFSLEDQEFAYTAQFLKNYAQQLLDAFLRAPASDGPALLKLVPPPDETGQTRRRIECLVAALTRLTG